MINDKKTYILLLTILSVTIMTACGSLQSEPQTTTTFSSSPSVETTLESSSSTQPGKINFDLLSQQDLQILAQYGYPDSNCFVSSKSEWYPSQIQGVSVGETGFQDHLSDIIYCFIQTIDDQVAYYDIVTIDEAASPENMIINDERSIQSMPISPDVEIWIQGNPPLYYSISTDDLAQFIKNLPSDDYLMGFVAEQGQITFIYDVYKP